MSGINIGSYDIGRIAQAVKVVMATPSTTKRQLQGMLGNLNAEIVLLETAIEQCPVEAPKEK